MLEEIAAAAFVGLSFSNAGVCIVLAAGCAAEHIDSGRYFIIGRSVGIVLIGLLIALLGVFITSSIVLFFVLLFGIISVLFGIILLVESYYDRTFGFLESFTTRHSKPGAECKNRGSGAGDGACKKGEGRHMHDAAGVTPKYRRRRRFLTLGLIRGATPCVKLMVIAPLLIVSPLPLAFAMILAFALASSIYPIIGFVGIGAFGGFERYRRQVKAAGAVAIIIIGIYLVANHVLSSPGGA